MTRARIVVLFLLTAGAGAVIGSELGAANTADRSGSVIAVVAVGASSLVGLGMGVLTLFITRREVEARNSELDRRLTAVETNSRADAGDLHEKINRVDKALSAVEVETRLQSKTLDLQSHQLAEILKRLPVTQAPHS